MKRFYYGLLRNPDPEASGGGGDGGESASHDSDAGALFGDKPDAGNNGAAPAGGSGGGATETPPAESKSADAKGDKSSAFGKFGTKPTAPAKPADTTPAASDNPEDKINLGDKASGDTRKHFDSLKGITKTLRTDIAARDARIKELEAKAASGTATPADYEKLKSEHKALSDRLAVVDLQSHPDFAKRFGEPKAKLIGGLNTVLADNKVDGVDLPSLLNKPRPEFAKTVSEIAAKLPAFEQQAFLSDMRQLYTLEGEAKGELARAGEISAALQKKTEADQRAAFAKTWGTLDFNSDGLEALEIPADASAEEKASIEAYNAGIKGIRTAAEGIAFGKMDEAGVATAATKAAAFDFMRSHAIPRMEAEFSKARALIASLTEEVKALKANRSGTGGGGGGGGGSEEESHEAAASAAFRK